MSDRPVGPMAIPDGNRHRGTPFASHTDAEVEAMLDAVGAASIDDLFDIPEPVRFDGSFGIEAKSEQAVRRDVGRRLQWRRAAPDS